MRSSIFRSVKQFHCIKYICRRSQHIPSETKDISDGENGVKVQKIVQKDIDEIKRYITKFVGERDDDFTQLGNLASYNFDFRGKLFRPLTIALVSQSINEYCSSNLALSSQHKVAAISEMIHTASLVHDDVIDFADTRRGRATMHKITGEKKAILVGDYILSRASLELARIGRPDVVMLLSQVIEDLIRGEFMQLRLSSGTSDRSVDWFEHYLRKTYMKTASLIANSCQAAALLATNDTAIHQASYEYGRNIGMAFQLLDDLLDLTASSLALGKPADGSDLACGQATAPVLYAAQQSPELRALIARRFSEEGDVPRALSIVRQSDGIAATRRLASHHCRLALDQIPSISAPASPYADALATLTQLVLDRSS